MLKRGQANLSGFVKVRLLYEYLTRCKKEGQFWNPQQVYYSKLTLLASFDQVLPKLWNFLKKGKKRKDKNGLD